MPGFAIKHLPDPIHRRLKERARLHHRSMTQEALSILERGLSDAGPSPLPPVRKGKFPLTEAWLKRVKRAGLE
jgi:hypothetical protein